jgi:hypothetical protein
MADEGGRLHFKQALPICRTSPTAQLIFGPHQLLIYMSHVEQLLINAVAYYLFIHTSAPLNDSIRGAFRLLLPSGELIHLSCCSSTASEIELWEPTLGGEATQRSQECLSSRLPSALSSLLLSPLAGRLAGPRRLWLGFFIKGECSRGLARFRAAAAAGLPPLFICRGPLSPPPPMHTEHYPARV